MFPSVRSLLLGLVLTAVAMPSAAGTQDDAVILVHAAAHTAAPRYAEVEATPCRDYVVDWPLNTPADLYLVVANGDSGPGIAGVSCGIAYNGASCLGASKDDGVGVDVFSWTLCVPGTEVPNGTGGPEDIWPASCGGNRITWDPSTDCRREVVGINGVQVVVGVFYVTAYTADFFQVIENVNTPTGPELVVVDCDGNESPLLAMPEYVLGYCRFGDYPIVVANPCGETPVLPSSWGRVKQQY